MRHSRGPFKVCLLFDGWDGIKGVVSPVIPAANRLSRHDKPCLQCCEEIIA